MSDQFSLTFWGARGSLPVSGAEYQLFGGNTACIHIKCGETDLLFDAGSGIPNAVAALAGRGLKHFNLFFSHSHYDHILGLPFFEPLFNPSFTVDIWAGHLNGRMTPRGMVEDFLRPPWVAKTVDIDLQRVRFHDFSPGDTLEPESGVVITTTALRHPGGCVGYRIHWRGRSIALVYDIEHTPGKLDPVAVAFMKDADLVVYDSAYLDKEMNVYKGFGHSSWQQGLRLRQVSSAQRMVFFHHMPSRTDAELLAIERAAQDIYPHCHVAREGMRIDI
jgi:phosphoribosyl 1,2-cyclic phosphodiesterase